MLSRRNGALRRLQAILIGLGLSLVLPSAGLAHEGHDHGAPTRAALTSTTPRVSAQSEGYELVGILRGDRLQIFLDRFESNEPVPDAQIAVTLGGDEQVEAERAADGTYAIKSAKLSGSGRLELIFAVTALTGDDLLIGALDLPAKDQVAAPTPVRPSALQALQNLPATRVGTFEIGTPYLIAGVAVALGFLLGLAVRSRRKLVPVAGLAVGMLLVSAVYAYSHEGHDHGADQAKAALPAGDTPTRLPDGTLFVPKPTQRLLAVRTVLAKPEQAQKAVNLIGRVVADPNRGGIVQSLTGGRVVPAQSGLPQVGQTVRRGDTLALVEPALPAADRTTISERSGEIEQLISVAETKLRRIRQLAERGITPQSQVVDAETELEGLRKRRDIVRQVRVEPEVLRAPADGVIASSRVVAGQVVQPQDVLFQIVDPKGLWVEALAYSDVDPARLTDATAAHGDGPPLKLVFRGVSKALQQQATILQFAIENPPPSLAVGQAVTVIAKTGAPVTGIVMPRDAVVRSGNGEVVVWRHSEPERFEARPVRTEPFDATRLVIRAGVGEDERIVVRGAELINQIR